MHKNDIVLQAFDDFFSPKVIVLSIVSLLITFAMFVVIFYFAFEYVGEWKEIIPTVFNDKIEAIYKTIESYPWLAFLLEHKIVMLLVRYLLYFSVGFLFYYLFFALYSFVISFFNGYFIGHIQKKYYEDVSLTGIGIGRTVFFYIKTIIVTITLFLILSPTYIIPALNLLIFIPIYYFFHKTIVFDVSSVINTVSEYKKIKKVNWSELKAHTGYCFLLTLIPVVGILLYPYYVLYIGHYILQETRELHYINDFQRLK
jgi:hypothetical protein